MTASRARRATVLTLASAACTTLLLVAGTVSAQQNQTGPRPAGPPPGAMGAGPGGPGAAPARVSLDEGPWQYDTEAGRIRVSVYAEGLQNPWGLAFLPNGDMLVTERPGRLRVIRDGELDPAPIEGVPEVRAAVIGGLMDIVLHPQFEQNRLIYLSYSKPNPEDPTMSATAVARAKWDGGSTLEQVEDIFVADEWYGSSIAGSNDRCCGQGPADGSFGGRMIFDDDGYLYVTNGDRNWGERVQDPSNHYGTILRLNDDGSVPSDNPFVGREGYAPEIYTLGHRNPTGLTVHPTTGELWSTEFGPQGGDEVNLIEAGKNYGWMRVTHGNHYDGAEVELGRSGVPGMEDPVLHWEPSINPGNLAFYDGDAFPQWRGDMLMAAMGRTLLHVDFENGEPVSQDRLLTDLGHRFRDVRVAPDGVVYVLTDEREGAILKIEPAR